MYVATVPNRNSPPAILLRESFRLGGKVRNRTLSNLSHWPPAQLDALRSVLKGATSIGPPLPQAFDRSEEHTSELQSPCNLVCRLLLEKKKKKTTTQTNVTNRGLFLTMMDEPLHR